VALAAAVWCALALGAPWAGPAASAEDAAGLRAQADALAGRYFAAMARAHALDAEIARTEAAIADLSTRAARLRDVARARAIVAYERGGTGLAAVLDAGDAAEMSRRIHLLAGVNAIDLSASRRLRALAAGLAEHRAALAAQRQAQTDALNTLRADGAAIDAKLAAAQAQDAPGGTSPPSSTTRPPSTSRPPNPTSGSPATTRPTTTTAPPSPVPSPPPGYVGTPGTNPHHDDPFLTCVRLRESSGNYGAVNPDGPYLGAYQFFQTTWNLAASHADLTGLVGVPANLATPYDQDAVAWALYQWQGAAPWGGSCP